MSKIVQAANSMISNIDKISNVVSGTRDLFFLYNGKYKWSIWLDGENDEYYLFYYPGKVKLEQLASMDDDEWVDFPFVTYKTSDLGTKEARATFAELYQVVKEQLFGMNNVLDDIISDEIPF